MKLRTTCVALAFAALAACQPAVPDSAANVPDTGTGAGFGNAIGNLVNLDAFNTEDPGQAERDAALNNSAPLSPDPVTVTSVPTPTFPAPVSETEAQAASTAAAANSGVAPVEASPANAPPPILNNPGISDEQDFDAVASRETIASDAARIEANRQQYQVVEPTALPSRGGTDTNIVAYALQTSHPKGTKVHRRLALFNQARHTRNCASYASADLAQIDFLERGGPSRDRRGLDPDGDGYACAWDPAPFRRAARN
ncbi:MAG: hypothetical protein HRU30_00780 [Rhodobacteraceae bacterium]|nr:hypothetical protein [Paracoccaceae bacterium]